MNEYARNQIFCYVLGVILSSALSNALECEAYFISTLIFIAIMGFAFLILHEQNGNDNKK